MVEKIQLEGKPFFILGAHPEKCAVTLLHQSISRTHSALIVDESRGLLLVDLLSTAGTQLNGESLLGLAGYPLKVRDQIKFGFSTRTYHVKSIDYSRMQRDLEIEKRQLEKQIESL